MKLALTVLWGVMQVGSAFVAYLLALVVIPWLAFIKLWPLLLLVLVAVGVYVWRRNRQIRCSPQDASTT